MRVIHHARSNGDSGNLPLNASLRRVERAGRNIDRFVDNGALPLDRGLQQQPRLVRRTRAEFRDAQARAIGRRAAIIAPRMGGQNAAFRARQVVLGQFGDLRRRAAIRPHRKRARRAAVWGWPEQSPPTQRRRRFHRQSCKLAVWESRNVVMRVTWMLLTYAESYLRRQAGFRKIASGSPEKRSSDSSSGCGRGRDARPAAQHHLPAHEFAVVFAQRAFERAKSGIAQIGAARPHPAIAPEPLLLHVPSFWTSSVAGNGHQIPESSRFPSTGWPSAAASHSNSVGRRCPAQRA